MKLVKSIFLGVSLLAGLSAHGFLTPADNTTIGTAGLITVSATVTNAIKLAANSYRRYLLISNLDATNAVYLSYSGSTGVSASTGPVIKISAGTTFEPRKAPTNAIYLFTTGAAVSTTIISGN